MLELSDRQRATVLAALRYWQQDLEANIEEGTGPISPHFEDHEPLTAGEIDELCERLNSPEREAGPVTTRYVLYSFDRKKLMTTQVFADADEAANFAPQLNDVLVVPLRLFRFSAD